MYIKINKNSEKTQNIKVCDQYNQLSKSFNFQGRFCLFSLLVSRIMDFNCYFCCSLNIDTKDNDLYLFQGF